MKCISHENCSLAHIGAILNGTAGVVVCVVPSVISALWFPAGQRTTSTGDNSMLESFRGNILCVCVLSHAKLKTNVVLIFETSSSS